MRCTIYTHDPMLTLLYTPETSVDLFGNDYLEEYGIEIPDELAKELLENYDRFWVIQEKLKQYLKENEGR